MAAGMVAMQLLLVNLNNTTHLRFVLVHFPSRWRTLSCSISNNNVSGTKCVGARRGAGRGGTGWGEQVTSCTRGAAKGKKRPQSLLPQSCHANFYNDWM